MEPTLSEALLLALAALVAGTIDAIAGGGGLVTLPALLATGLPTPLAFGTNKGQSVFGSGAALWRYARAGLVDGRRAAGAFALGFGGSLAGAALLLAMRPEVLRPIVLVLLVGVAAFVLLRKGAPPAQAEPTPARRRLGHLLALAIGAYDGFFGPGTGTFLIAASVGVMGDSLQRASANAKVVNFASNLAALTLFWHRGVIVWSYALPMAAAQLAGGVIGAQLGVRVGDRLVRRVLVVVSLTLVAKIAGDLLRAA